MLRFMIILALSALSIGLFDNTQAQRMGQACLLIALKTGGDDLSNGQVASSTSTQLWAKINNGNFPPNALKVGYEADGRPLYIARTAYKGGVVIGKTWDNSPTAAFSYEGHTLLLSSFSVYTGRGYWVKVRQGDTVPPNAILAGNEADGSPLFIARALIANGLHIGNAQVY
ncbi:MAG: DM9 repeat-containing protein [Runella sp.]